MNPTQTQDKAIEIRRQRGIFNLDTMDELTLVKVGSFEPATTSEEALKRCGNDSAKLLAIINEGLEAEAGRAMVTDSSVPWQQEDEEGKLSAFEGTPANMKMVNGLILNLAKSIFKFNKDMNKEQKRAAKDKAIDFIRANDTIKQGLKENASLEAPEVVVE